ncbi:S24 family peptidase [Mesorhizobium sp.]|uniref:LexA family transcriptional regulator n=1 Tax=Mesorhizobium sp. TaxID=1871066 RepID=UPI0025BDC87B|nr:S24 family peptidase [Mesorhizobium sp.]
METVKPVYASIKDDPSELEFTFADRLRALVAHFDPKSDRAFARRVGISPTSLQNYLKDQTPRLDQAASIAASTGVSVGWLATGAIDTPFDGEMHIEMLTRAVDSFQHGSQADKAALHGKIDEIRRINEAFKISDERMEQFRKGFLTTIEQLPNASEQPAPAGFITVPKIEIRPSAGAGSLDLYEESEPDIFAFREEWLRRIGVSPKFARLMVAKGDSMRETIDDGDLMIVDVSVREFIDEAIYVLVYGGLVRVKRLQLLHSGMLLLKSDNPRYQTEEVPLAEQQELIIGGRVRWAGGSI